MMKWEIMRNPNIGILYKTMCKHTQNTVLDEESTIHNGEDLTGFPGICSLYKVHVVRFLFVPIFSSFPKPQQNFFLDLLILKPSVRVGLEWRAIDGRKDCNGDQQQEIVK